MHQMRHLLHLIALLAIVCSGCGQTGALYLPDQGKSTPATSAPSDSESAETDTEGRPKQRGATQDAPASDTETPVTPPDPDRPAQTPQGPGVR